MDYFEFHGMERNGDVIAELQNCNSPNCALITNSFGSGKYKMCKDDIVAPLFCSPPHLRNGIIMDSKPQSPHSYITSDENKFEINFFNGRKKCINNNNHLSISKDSASHLKNSCSFPWENSPKLQNFCPSPPKELLKNLYVQDSYINAHNSFLSEKKSLSNTTNNLESSLNSLKEAEEKLLLDYEAETSSSSFEDAYTTGNYNQIENKLSDTNKIESDSCVVNSKSQPLLIHGQLTPISSPNCNRLSESEQKDALKSPTKNDRIMPELLPTLISLENDEPAAVKKKSEIIDVADSPEMPILIPFTSEVDEAFQIKTEVLSDNEKYKLDSDSHDSNDAVQQPKVVLKRLSVNSCQSASISLPQGIETSSSIGPEIEEIEGVRFFQFRSKVEMEEFNKEIETIDLDVDMIVPTKTTDITQIKGWRTKYFAPESEFHPESYDCNKMKTEDSVQDANDTINEANESGNKNTDKENISQSTKSESSKETADKSNSEDIKENKQANDSSSSSDDKEFIDVKNIKKEKPFISKSHMSAFISEELDNFLLHSSTLNVSILEKVNPNIIPIPPNAPILSLGKLRKTDKPPIGPMIFMRRRETTPDVKVENIPVDSVITLSDSPASSNVITLDSSEEAPDSSSTDDDIPVANLRSRRRTTSAKKNVSSDNRGPKRKSLDSERASKRVVLRLTKEGTGVSKGYKVSNITCKKDKQNLSSPSSPAEDLVDSVVIPEDGSLPVIKQTLFSKKNEPNLLDEFLNNLNMYGTRKDVAMLVQSNQSYFEEPVLDRQTCSKALSVLLSNNAFLDMKQKSKKEKT